MRSPRAGIDLVVDALHVAIDGTPVLHDVCFRIPSGSLAAIVGPSGSGKSTILRAVAGLQPATSGHIRLGEHELTDVGGSRTLTVRPEHRGIGWVPQAPSLFPHMTVAEHVDFGALPRAGRGRRERAIARETASPLLALVGIEALADRYPDQLSGGQAQRVALARALAAQPAALLLDEPFSALDPSLRKDLRDEVRALLHRLGVTALLVTHDQDEALATADSILVINEGRVRQHDEPSIVYRRPASRWVAAFIGEANFLGAAIVGGRASTPLGEILIDTVGPAGPSDAGACAVMVRPEQIVIDHAGVPAFVERVRYGGHDAFVSLLIASSGNGQVRVIARWAASIVPKEGETIAISLSGAGLLLPD